MKDPRVYLVDILEAVKKIESYSTERGKSRCPEKLIEDAVIRNLTIIGEAVKRIPDSLREDYPDIPWKQIAGARDRMVHDYDDIVISVVWNAVENDLPALKQHIEHMLAVLDA
jgi:uncharacterized protein with HEPN domain